MLNQDFQVLQVLGQGSCGTVFLVQNQLSQRFALKRIQINPFKQHQALQQIELMAKLQHQNLLILYDYGITEQEQYLQMLTQYCEKGDLLAFFKKNKKKISPQKIINIMYSIVKAFLFINQNNIIHRDLKPENILISRDNCIKIGDFGCARNVDAQTKSKQQNMSYDKGTPIYSSPQQLENYPYSSKCDIWAFGCIVYLLYFGRHPFYSSSIQQTVKKIKSETQDRKIILKQQTDKTIKKIIERTLVYSQIDRASWRQLSLTRLFHPKIEKVNDYLEYLCSLTNIANWIAKQIWKIRKIFIDEANSYTFTYFMIKFQHSNMIMAAQILAKSQQFEYMFTPQAYNCSEYPLQLCQQIRASLHSSADYYTASRNHFQKHESFVKMQYQCSGDNCSSFTDLQITIKTGYKILKDYVKYMKDKMEGSSIAKIQTIWVILSKWINFQCQFFYQKNPHLNQLFNCETDNGIQIIENMIHNYQKGIIQ